MKFIDFYQEEPGGTFTHDGKDYLLNPLLKFTKNLPVEDISVDKLSWITDGQPDEEFEYADMSVPILVTHWKDKFVVIDGYHRLLKAINHGVETLPAKIVPEKLLNYFEDPR